MALFRQCRGSRASLDAQPLHDGYAYFCTDDGTFHIDYADADGNLHRKQINAKEAEELVGYDITTTLNSSDVEIPTSKTIKTYVDNAVANAGSSIELDTTLTQSGKAADAKSVGDALAGKANTSDIPAKVSDLTNDSGFITGYTETDPTVPDHVKNISANDITNWNNKSTFDGNYNSLTNKPTIPTALSGLTDDSTHRTVTDAEKAAWNAKSDFSGSYNDLTNKPTIPTVPTKVSAFDNDKGYLTSYTETDPTVPDWAKASTKPSYTKSEVGLGNVDNVKQYSASNPPPYPVTSVNGNTGAVTVSVPTKVSELTNDSGYLTSVPSEYVTETELNAKGYLTQHQSLSGYAKTTDHYTKTESDNKYQVKGNYLTSVPSEYVTETELSAKGYLTSAPVTKVNNKTGAVTLSASDVGADASGTASSAVSAHNTNTSAHADIREQISQLSSEKVDKTGVTLGVHTDGYVYIFVNGSPQGNGLDIKADVIEGDVFGYVDESNNIVLNGNLADGTYTIKYEMADGSTVDIGNLVLDTNVYYSVTKTLTQCTINNSATKVIAGESYSATITANSGYELKSVTVTMGGSSISVNGGSISIAKVTGDIVISAVAEEKAKEPTNFVVYDETNTSDWNKWINNARAGSDGTYRSDTVSADYGTPAVSNYIAVQNGDVVEITGMYTANKSTVVYNSSKTILSVGSPSANTSIANYTHTDSNYTAQFTINNTSAAFLRVGGYTSIDKVGVPVIRIKRNGEYL